MYLRIYMVAVLLLLFSCNRMKNSTEELNEHNHLEKSSDKHNTQEEIKFQYTSYSEFLEVFAEADPLIVGNNANILSHFSFIPSFKPVESGKMRLELIVEGIKNVEILDHPTRKGIFSFNIKPTKAGKGIIKYTYISEKGNYEIIVPNVFVYNSSEEAKSAFDKLQKPGKTNTTVFTKEQSWKVDFASSLPFNKPFGQIIKTTGLIESTPGDELILSAKTSGIVVITSNTILEGKDVSKGQTLFQIIGETADNNISVKYMEAKNNFEKASSDFERAKDLYNEKIISTKEMQTVKNQYENTKVIYDNIKKNFSSLGQTVSSSMSGYLKQVLVKNGSYVEVGQPLVVVSQSKTLQITANIPQKYYHVLPYIKSANFRSSIDNQMHSFEELNGKILSFGKSANAYNFMIPVHLQIDNNADFVPGSFVDLFLIASNGTNTLSLPNSSLMEEQGIFFVWVQITPELFEKREVKIGGTDGMNTEIKSGILPLERVVIKGATMIKLAQATGSLDAHSGHVH